MKTYIIKLNGKEYTVEIAEVAEGAVQPQAQPQQTSAGERILAPLPGNILDIRVTVKEAVKKGQTLAILEAMKLENEIVAPRDGIITAISVSKGETVETGVTIMTIA